MLKNSRVLKRPTRKKKNRKHIEQVYLKVSQ